MVSVREIEWMAGFLEGEGCFRWDRANSRTVSVAQKNPEPIDKLYRLCGGYVYRRQLKQWGKENDLCSYWNVKGARARGIMMTIYSLMSARRKAQISKALSSGTGRWHTNKRTFTDDLVQRVIAEHRAGATSSSLAKKYRLSGSRVARWIRSEFTTG